MVKTGPFAVVRMDTGASPVSIALTLGTTNTKIYPSTPWVNLAARGRENDLYKRERESQVQKNQMQEKLVGLSKLYERIFYCRRCINAFGGGMTDDSARVMRVLEKRASGSKLFLVGQALGEWTQRLSGRPYVQVDGHLSQSGENLDRFLRLLGFTINPFDSITGCQYTYSSDVIQCYPGKNHSGRGDRRPETLEINNCQEFLLEEIDLIEPRVPLLMGKESRDSFYGSILRIPYPTSLSGHIEEVASTQQLPSFQLLGRNVFVSPIQHPSGANPKFHGVIQNSKFIELIKGALR